MPEHPLPPGVEEMTDEQIYAIAEQFIRDLGGDYWHSGERGISEPYVVDFVRAIEAKAARAGYLAGLEAAAKVCDTVPVCNLLGTSLGYEQGKEMAVVQCKSAIRSLGETK